jgi:hypothetical protein
MVKPQVEATAKYGIQPPDNENNFVKGMDALALPKYKC